LNEKFACKITELDLVQLNQSGRDIEAGKFS